MNTNNNYQTLAAYYDQFTEDVQYTAWVNFFENLFTREQLQPKLILDLACGTGSLTKLLARRGDDMIGVDASADMLMQAMEHTLDCTPRPLFLQQRMEDLDLYGTVDVCLCCLDSINYITDSAVLRRVFERVYTFLEPDGGLFAFDINTPEKFARIDGNSYVREGENVFCVWRAAVENELCAYAFDIFERQGHLWTRAQEVHEERIYTVSTLLDLLRQTGFSDIKTYGGQDFSPVRGGEDRIYFSARRRNSDHAR